MSYGRNCVRLYAGKNVESVFQSLLFQLSNVKAELGEEWIKIYCSKCDCYAQYNSPQSITTVIMYSMVLLSNHTFW